MCTCPLIGVGSQHTKTFPGNSVMFGGGSQPVEGVGEIPMDCLVAGKTVRVVLKNVLYVPTPGAPFCLSSKQRRLGATPFCTMTVPASTWGTSASLRRLLTPMDSGELQVCRWAISGAVYPCTGNGIHSGPELWHRRFGHLGYENLAKLVANEMVTGIKVSAESFGLSRKLSVSPVCSASLPESPSPLHTHTQRSAWNSSTWTSADLFPSTRSGEHGTSPRSSTTLLAYLWWSR